MPDAVWVRVGRRVPDQVGDWVRTGVRLGGLRVVVGDQEFGNVDVAVWVHERVGGVGVCDVGVTLGDKGEAVREAVLRVLLRVAAVMV